MQRALLAHLYLFRRIADSREDQDIALMNFHLEVTIPIGSHTLSSTFDNDSRAWQLESVFTFYGTFDSYFLSYQPKREKPTENKQSDFVCVIHTFIRFNAPKVSLSFVTTKKKAKI